MRDREEKGNVNCFFILTIHIKKVRQRHMETDKQRLCEREGEREEKRGGVILPLPLYPTLPCTLT